ncbi:NAD-dependent epimerase/dehydratase family protein [Polaribacter dokdonensis]|uniref:NAD dependent epimerase/dehydratase family protein n=1 Tax=Polaribacter dokdonensis DSW-5 TaxID=1300348 RepID=A0A0M9CEC7_9FLAO|nr:NAD(P)-dependent oxidoreductase [Polaribacter dokdonensis]KOY50656.1 NAD dependent epimerase/dehydratase family protein [Polaribacter dokdonensis DSW-5]SEE62319.1 Nucleoside-diphosphate-sugar epimerase [Polaribacter dokdonensis DSW-5]
MSKILITGGSGFIGTNVVEHFISNNYEVINIDIVKPKIKKHKSYWLKGDINDLFFLNKATEEFNPEFIIHLAAKTDLNGKTLEDYKTNIRGVENLLSVSNNLGNLKKILIFSSMLVCKPGFIPVDQLQYRPSTVYGESKVLTEKIVWENVPKCDWAILRPTSIWGPWFDVPYKNFFDIIMKNKYFHIGSSGCTKTYGFVLNTVYQIDKILLAKTTNKKNKVFYLGDHPPTNIETWANEIGTELNIKIKRMPFSLIKFAGYFGDFLNLIGLSFPMTSFRLKNMTTNNIVCLENTSELAPVLPYTRIEGVKKTLIWIKEQ